MGALGNRYTTEPAPLKSPDRCTSFCDRRVGIAKLFMTRIL